MQVGDFVTLRSEDVEYKDALIVEEGVDNFTGENDIFVVWHPHYSETLDFYQQPDLYGHCSNVGNCAYWIE